MSLTIFNKEYDGEDVRWLIEDVNDSLDKDYNYEIKKIPIGADELYRGKFTVSIVWSGDND